MLKLYGLALVVTLMFDALWLGFMVPRFFRPKLSTLFTIDMQYAPAALFYLLFATGLTVFVIAPAVTGGYGIGKIFLLGALFGLVAYGTYDLTNHATIAGWPLMLTVTDMLWGSIMTGVSSVIVRTIYERLIS